MVITKPLVLLVALIQTANSLFFWFPEYRCLEDNTCSAASSDVTSRALGASLKLVQRLPKENTPHDAQIRSLAARLTRKYQRATTVQSHGKQERENEMKRANAYNIVSAAPPSQTNSAGIDQDGTDYSYFATVLLGSGSTPFHMLLDSGASQSWVMGTSCTSPPCLTHNTFGPTDSSTYQAVTVNSAFSVAYGSGGVSGVLANDSLSIAGIKLPMTLGIANYTSNDFNAFPVDGILGLSRTNGTYPNFIQTLVSSKALNSNVFGISLNRAVDGPNTGEINFGAPDETRYSGSVSYTAVSNNSSGSWAIPMNNTGVVGTNTGITDRLAYFDTGTSYIFAPPSDVAKFHSLIPGSKSADNQTYSVPCSTTTPATFTFSGVTYNVSSEDWVGPKVNEICTSNIYGHAVVDGAWLLGDTFLKNVYIVFDVDQSRVGLAKVIVPPSTTTSTVISPTSASSQSPAAETSTSPSSSPTKISSSVRVDPELSAMALAAIVLTTLIFP